MKNELTAPAQSCEPWTKQLNYWALGRFHELVAKYDKAAKKLGVAPIKFHISALQESRPTAVKSEKWYDITFEGDPLKIAGWKFVGAIEHTGAGNILKSPIKDLIIPESYREATPVCEHCATKRRRNDTFIMQHDDGSFKQIGRNCLRDFLGHDPRLQLMMLDIIREINENDYEGYGGPCMADLKSFLALTAHIARVAGFYKSTGDTAWGYHFPSKDLREMIRKGEAPDYKASDIDYDFAAKAIQWLETGAQLNSFISNLKVIAKMPYISMSHVNMAAWIIGAYVKQLGWLEAQKAKADAEKAGREADKARCQHVGEIGKRMEISLSLVDSIEIEVENRFADRMFRHKFADTAGNVFVWFTSNSWSQSLDGTATFETVKLTIKRHDEYKGVKQNVVNRVALVTAKAQNGAA